MGLFEAFRLALRGLIAARLRAALTMLGILIGVGAVIVLVAVGNGNAQQINTQIQSLGSNLLTVFSNAPRGAGGITQAFGSGNTLTFADVTALSNRDDNPDVTAVVPVVTARATEIYGSQNAQTQVTGTSPQFPQVRNYQVAAGNFFTDADVANSSRVAVLGQTTVQTLFGTQDPLDKDIRVGNEPFHVIGVFASKGASGGLQNADDTIVVPSSAVQAYLSGGKNVSQINVEAASADVGTLAQAEVTQTLMTTHHLTNPLNLDFQIFSQNDLLTTASSISSSETFLLAAIAAISLLVGGIGIMNIMLVTVTERTREIGIRKAIGARRQDIVIQFLIEATVLSATGGAAGVLGGIAVAAVLPHVNSALPTAVSTSSVALAFGVSVAIGLFFGLYPANRAARLHPIQALRYE